jgi:hypothetical protein
MKRPRPINIIIFIVFFVGAFIAAMRSRNAPASNISALSTPKATIIAVPSAPPKNWIRLEGKGLAIQLPDSYIGGNIQEFSKLINQMADKESPQIKALIEQTTQNPDQFVFLAYDRASNPTFLTNVNVVKTRVSNQPVPLNDIMQALIKQYPDSFKIVENDVIKINDVEVIRFVLDVTLQNGTSKALQYLRVDANNDAWVVTYSTASDEFKKRLAKFETSYQSFELLLPSV